MELKISTRKISHEIEVGDIVVFDNFNDNTPYLIIKENNQFIAKNMDGRRGATGNHHTLEGLVESIKKHNVTHYSKNEYSLELVKK